MKSRNIFIFAIVIVAVFCFSCHKDSGTEPDNNNEINITGNWTGTHNTGVVNNVTYVFTQSGNTVTGNYTNNTTGGAPGEVTGTINGNNITYRIDGAGYWSEHTGTITGNTISGTIDAQSGGATGTFTITKQ